MLTPICSVDCRAKILFHYIELDPSPTFAWINKGNSLSHLGRLEEALTCFERSLKICPDLALAWSNKGTVLEALSRESEARAAFARAKKLGLG